MVDGMVPRGAAARSGVPGEGRSPASLPGPPGSVVSGEPLPGGSHRPDAFRALETCDLRGTAGLRGVSGAAPLPAPPVPIISEVDSRAGTRGTKVTYVEHRVAAKADKAAHRQGWPRTRTSASRQSLLGWSPAPSRRGRPRARAAPPCSDLPCVARGKPRVVREVRREIKGVEWRGKGSLIRACRVCLCARLHEW